MKKLGKDLVKSLNTGISYFLPVIIAGGMLFALAIGTGDIIDNKILPANQFFADILTIGQSGFAMMVPVLAAYIAYAIAGKPGLAPGFILGYVVNNPIGSKQLSTGFIGAMLIGIIIGYVVKWMKTWRVPAVIRTVMPLLIIPLLTTFVVGIFYVYVLAWPISELVVILTQILNSMNGAGAVVLGLAIGVMAAIDMGGPSSKAATAFTLALMGEGIYGPNGAFRICCAVPPLGLALSTFISRKKYTAEEREFGVSAFFLSLAGITEGAIPFAAKDFKRVLPAICIGTAVSGALAMVHQVDSIVAFGGLAALPAVTSGKLWYVIDMFAGAFVIAFIMHITRKNKDDVSSNE
jgi:PTS system fructose-specific IIC component/fructose-specific PTS system IIC-like component